jgi:hypothetical protein
MTCIRRYKIQHNGIFLQLYIKSTKGQGGYYNLAFFLHAFLVLHAVATVCVFALMWLIVLNYVGQLWTS